MAEKIVEKILDSKKFEPCFGFKIHSSDVDITTTDGLNPQKTVIKATKYANDDYKFVTVTFHVKQSEFNFTMSLAELKLLVHTAEKAWKEASS